MINLPEAVPEFAIKHLIEWSHLALPPPSGRGGGLIETNPDPTRLGSLRGSGPGAPRGVTPDPRGFWRSRSLLYCALRRARVIEALTPLGFTTSKLSRDGESTARR